MTSAGAGDCLYHRHPEPFREVRGQEALFAGLHIHDRWNWSVRYPVVRLDFAGGSFKEPGAVHRRVMESE